MAKKKRDKFPVRLQKAIKDCERYTKPMKSHRQIILNRYAAQYFEGHDYIEQLYQLTGKARPINMVFRYITIMMPYLAQYMPKTFVTPKGNPLYAITAEMLGKGLTHLKKEIRYRDTFRRIVLDALTYIGAIKLGLCPNGTIEWGGETHQNGQIFADVVDPDDLIFDVGARRWADLLFIGNKYRLPLKYVQESGLFKHHDQLQRASKIYGHESPEAIAKAEVQESVYHELYDMVELYDAYMVNEGVLLTLPIEGEGEKIMRTVDMLPEGGPYELLSFHEFPGSLLPIPPAYNALDLDDAVNRISRRLDQQLRGQKTILAYEDGASDDANRVTKATDGSTIKVSDISRLKEITFGAPQGDNIAVADWYIRQFSEQQGNLNTLGGIRSESKTLGQERLKADSAQGTVEDMYESLTEFATRVEGKMAWYLMANPFVSIPMIKEVPGVPGGLSLTYNNETRDGEFIDFNYEMKAYSTQGKTPEVAYQQLLSAVNQIVLPFIDVGAQQGMTVDIQRLVQAASKYTESDDLIQIFKPADKDMQPPADPGPYQPMQGQNIKKAKNQGGQLDGRLGISDDEGASINAGIRNAEQEN